MEWRSETFLDRESHGHQNPRSKQCSSEFLTSGIIINFEFVSKWAAVNQTICVEVLKSFIDAVERSLINF
jgi:hypothetical protein